MPRRRKTPSETDSASASDVEHIAIFEPRLRDLRGHYAGMAVALAAAARAQGVKVSVWCDRAATPEVCRVLAATGADVRPVLRGSAVDRLRARVLIWPVHATFSAFDLRAARRYVGSHGVVFLPSGEIDTALASAIAAREQGAPIAVQFFAWNRKASDGRWTPGADAIIAVARRAVRHASHRLRLVAHGESMAEELATLLGRRVDGVPLAVDWTAIPTADAARPPGRIRVGVLGELRDEKGLPQLAEVVPLLGDEVEWHVQAAPGRHADETMRRTLVERVRTARGVLYESPLDRAGYGRLVAGCDVAVFPYDPRRYGNRTSGTLIEALGVGAIPVVPAGTWLADEAGDSAVVYEAYTTEALADALRRACAMSATGRNDRIAHAATIREGNSAGAVIRAVLGTAVVG